MTTATGDLPQGAPAPDEEHVVAGQDPVPDRAVDHPGGRRWWPGVVCGAAYLLLAFAVFGLTAPLGSGQMAGVHTPDQMQQIWFLEWARFAIAHGHNPFYSAWMNYPVGINLGVNTSMLALGVLVSPLTALLGAVETWNLLLRLALFVSATSMCLVLRRWVRWWPAAFAGGLLYGFSTFATFNAIGYLFLIMVPLPPVVFLLLFEILVRQRWRPAWTGALLGAVVAVQYLISSEIAASTMVMVVLACAVFALTCRAHAPVRWSYVRPAAVWGLVVTGVLVAYPVLFGFFGTAGIRGIAKQPGGQGDLLGPFVPGPEQWVAPVNSAWTQFDQYFAAAPMYLGIPFFLAVTATAIWLWHRPMVRFATLMTACAFVLSLGSPLRVHGTDTGIPLPFAVVAHLPLANGMVAARFTLFTALFGAGVLAMGLDEAFRRLHQRSPAVSRWRTVGVVGALAAVLVVVALPMVPGSVRPSAAAPVAPLFTSAGLRSLPDGSVALFYPYPGGVPKVIHGRPASDYPFVEAVDDSLLDQAVSGMRFRLIGGYGWMPPKRTGGVPDPTPLTPSSVQALFDVSFYGYPTPAQARALATGSLTADLRTFLDDQHVDEVIVLPVGRHPERVVAAVTAAVGPPTRSGGATLWLHVPERLTALGAPG